MSTAKDAAKRAIEKINTAKSSTRQSNALSELIAGVEQFVEAVKADAELAKELPKLNRELTEKQRFLNEPGIDRMEERQLQTEVADLSGTITEAENARKAVASNRGTLRSLQKDVERLRSAINSAL